jgi:uncharacterized glyoxalase superfamily protein PhnB
MRIEPHLMFNGRCQEAIAFYERAIGAKTTMVPARRVRRERTRMTGALS